MYGQDPLGFFGNEFSYNWFLITELVFTSSFLMKLNLLNLRIYFFRYLNSRILKVGKSHLLLLAFTLVHKMVV